jgi:hypothetical protein
MKALLMIVIVESLHPGYERSGLKLKCLANPCFSDPIPGSRRRVCYGVGIWWIEPKIIQVSQRGGMEIASFVETNLPIPLTKITLE